VGKVHFPFKGADIPTGRRGGGNLYRVGEEGQGVHPNGKGGKGKGGKTLKEGVGSPRRQKIGAFK